MASLRTQLSTWRTIKEAETNSLASSNAQLTQQLTAEIARGKALDRQIRTMQDQLVSCVLACDRRTLCWQGGAVQDSTGHCAGVNGA